MALDDKDLLAFVAAKNANQDVDYILAEFVKARESLAALERGQKDATPVAGQTIETEALPAAEQKRRWTRRSLKHDPATAITEKSVKCCLCGWEGTILTTRHLANHGITPEDYRRICGYDEKAPLMSAARARLLGDMMKKARKARDENRAAKESASKMGPVASALDQLAK